MHREPHENKKQSSLNKWLKEQKLDDDEEDKSSNIYCEIIPTEPSESTYSPLAEMTTDLSSSIKRHCSMNDKSLPSRTSFGQATY
ncbi:unnamed protein product, partial [Didymodactylos carnosus]